MHEQASEAQPEPSRRWIKGCVFVPLAVLGSMISLGAFVIVAFFAIARFDWWDPLKPPDLPEYAVPQEATYVSELEGYCGGSHVQGPPCRHVYFDAASFDESREDFVNSLESRGFTTWSYRGGETGAYYHLITESLSLDLCISYHAGPPLPTTGLLRISVTVFNCSKLGSG